MPNATTLVVRIFSESSGDGPDLVSGQNSVTEDVAGAGKPKAVYSTLGAVVVELAETNDAIRPPVSLSQLSAGHGSQSVPGQDSSTV